MTNTMWELMSRSLRRDWRVGELRVMVFSLVIAVAAVTAVSFFTDRVQRAMQRQAGELLAADMVIQSSSPLRENLQQQAIKSGLLVTQTVDFPSVVLASDQTMLVQVKAVAPGYPLRGHVKLADKAYSVAQVADGIPEPGLAWVDARLLDGLALPVGIDFGLGEHRLRIDKVIDYEPDRGGDLFRLAPRVMINIKDLAATDLVKPTSRVRYRLLLAGEATAVDTYRNWFEGERLPGEELQTVRDARPELRVALDRAQQYLSLAALVAVFVAGTAIALAARYFAAREADSSAIMRCLGAQQNTVLKIYGMRLLIMGLLASLMGCAVGYLAQGILAYLLQGYFLQHIPAPGWVPLLTGLLTGLLCLAGFALPPILRLRQVSPLRVLRRDIGHAPPSMWLTVLCALGALALLLILQSSDPDLALKLLSGGAVMVAVFAFMAMFALLLVERSQSLGSLAWRYGIARLSRNRGSSVLQIAAYALGVAALLVLAIARVDLLDNWRGSLPDNAPNHFLINIQQDERAGIERLFTQWDLAAPDFYPMARGRLMTINGQSVNAQSYNSPRAQRLISREFNLSWMVELPDDNKVVAGDWWDDMPEAQGFSVETGIAQTLGIELNDELQYQIGGHNVLGRVTSLREVEWDTFNVNFFVVGSPALLTDVPASLICSFYLPAGHGEFVGQLARSFPSVTVFNVDAIMSQVRGIMDRAALAVEYVFLFTLFAGLLVMYAAIESSQHERRREVALLRALGARRSQVLQGLLAEFLIIGAVAGMLACAAASLASYLLATRVFELEYFANPWLWVWGLLGAALIITIAGLLGTYRIMRQSPLLVLRRNG